MRNFDRYKTFINKLPFDLKAEVLLAEMITDDLQADEIEVSLNSVFYRNVHFDIEKVEETEYVTTKKRRLKFVLNRDGLYDLLPEDLFHQPADPQPLATKEKVLNEMQVQTQREKAARKFFLPYEQEFFRLRIRLEMEERKFMFANSGHVDLDVMAKIWNFPGFLSAEQKAKLGLLMPVMHRIVGNRGLCSFLATDISGDDVTVSESYQNHSGFSDNPVLKDAALGIDLILGGQYQSMEPCNTWKIDIRDISSLSQYLPGGKKAQLHEYLSNLMIPLENEVNFELDIKQAKEFKIGEEVQTAMLGYETYI
jgi:type VI secretion system protein ImpH